MSNQRGQALVEYLVSCVYLIPLVLSVCIGAGFLFSISWTHYQAYEGLICLAQEKPTIQCKSEMLRKIEQGSFFVNTNLKSFFATPSSAKINLELTSNFPLLEFRKVIQQQLSLPLIPNA